MVTCVLTTINLALQLSASQLNLCFCVQLGLCLALGDKRSISLMWPQHIE